MLLKKEDMCDCLIIQTEETSVVLSIRQMEP